LNAVFDVCVCTVVPLAIPGYLRRLSVVFALLGALAIAGCGGGGETSSASPGNAGSNPETVRASPANGKKDATKAVLRFLEEPSPDQCATAATPEFLASVFGFTGADPRVACEEKQVERQGLKSSELHPYEVLASQVRGDEAVVIVKAPKGDEIGFGLRYSGSTWRLDHQKVG
jgi:hypothetical protein